MVQEVTTTSWFSRIKNAFIGVLFGILLIIGAFFLIFWNESHGLHTAQSLQQAAKVVVTVPNSPVSSENNLKVVYLTGVATTEDNLKDALFGTFAKTIKLDRQVEMYQWQENKESKTEKQMGGSEKEITTYSYEKVWSDKLISSVNFKETDHSNPATMPINSSIEYAHSVTVGDFILPLDLVKKINNSTTVSLANMDLTPLKTKLNKPITQTENAIFVGEDINDPQIGDIKIHLSEVLPQEVSILAQQNGNTLQPYQAEAGENVMLLETGIHSSAELISQALSENTMVTWLLRAVALLLMIIGISLLMQPLVVFADFIPLVGSMVGFGVGFIALIGGLILWTIATAIAWFTFRPLWSLGLIVIVAAIIFAIYHYKKKSAR